MGLTASSLPVVPPIAKKASFLNGSAVIAKETLPASPSKYPTDTTSLPFKYPTNPTPKLSRNLGVPTPKEKKPDSPSLASALCNALEYLIDNFFDPAVLRPSVDPRNVLAGNFAPVDELPPTPCAVIIGHIPRCLQGGAYIRNGPNPQYLPRGPHHLFDGDGMLHSLLLSIDGDPILCSRYVNTYKYKLEHAAGGRRLPNFFSGFHGFAGLARGVLMLARVLTGQMNLLQGVGRANTSVAFFAERLYALDESDLPYAFMVDPDRGEISTLERFNFQGCSMRGMTAHPKKEISTGEVFVFRYNPLPPFLTYFRIDSNGNKLADVPIFSMRKSSLVHDLAITDKNVVFADIQLVVNPINMLIGSGSLVGHEPDKVPRVGVLPRYATNESEIRWFEVPGLNILHWINAWEEEGANGEPYLVLVAPNLLPIEHAIEHMELVHCSVEMTRINLESGEVSRVLLSTRNLDFGVIHPRYLGRKNRYAYLGVGDPMLKISGIVKLDFSLAGKGDCVVASRNFGPGCYGGEPFFVPNNSCNETDEDDGYVVSYVHNEQTGESRFVVIDARSLQLESVAEVLLPSRVPYGFHGLFISRAELESQCSMRCEQ